MAGHDIIGKILFTNNVRINNDEIVIATHACLRNLSYTFEHDNQSIKTHSKNHYNNKPKENIYFRGIINKATCKP